MTTAYPPTSALPRPVLPRAVARRRRMMAAEGPRGYATRTGVWLRYVSYLFAILIAAGLTQAAFAGEPQWHSGGAWMLFSACTTCAIGAVGTWCAPQERNKIVEQVRFYTFSLVVGPGLGLAMFMWAARGVTAQGAANGDAFLGLLHNALPILFFTTVMLPPVVFVKAVAGFYTLNKSRLDDEELVALYARQDGLQR